MPACTPRSDLSPALSRRPPAWLLLPQLRRGMLIWFLIHTLVWLVLQMLPDPAGTFAVGSGSAMIIVAATAALALIDARIMHEPLFYASLGMPRWVPAAGGAVAAGVMEVLISVLW